jgi:hypothetical protein
MFREGRPRRNADDGGPTLPQETASADEFVERERWVRCRTCSARIAPEASRTTVAGAHEHTFLNPAGMRFVVRCFGVAPGCTPEGDRSTVWTWFPGFAWQAALCGSCASHLGWSFHPMGGGAPFWALVIGELL